jgi:hypothetical protein
MSVKIMGQVWDLDNEVIKREEKYVLLAYTDHADHEGRNMYPSIELICEKTGYKERAVQLITRSLEEKGFLIADGKGRNGTNKWRYGGGANFAGVQNNDDGGANRKVEGVHPVAPEPNVIKPSLTIENAIASNQPVTEEMAAQAKLKDTAPKMFEKALGFSKPLPWWSNKEWTAFSEWVCNRYAESKISFGEYQIWRSDKYASGKMTNPRIRGFPAEFYDSWDMFLMSKETHKTDEERPEYKPFKSDDDDLEFVARPK